ncbi:MAG: MBL fold metallo-hydrolase [Candidatus Lokiarchaeota archaeon]|nr:MBL fold metallo-hydrolase [Candidatus Lokiarchaeota archaeon]
MVKISFLGSCREVGRSAILIESKSGAQCILDYGIRFTGENRLPFKADIHNLKAIALSHCHVDHSGGLPYLFKDSDIPFFTNPLTLRISEILLEDMIKVSNYPYPFGYREIKKTRKNALFLKNGVRQKIDHEFFLTFFSAGHIPGSVSILVEVDKKKILYTGDINNQETNLIFPANPHELPEIDALITESTYSGREHPLREKLEKRFIEEILNTIDNGGNVLIPAFGVARSQEILLVLEKYNYKNDIYIDGLARKILTEYSQFPESFRNFSHFKSAAKKAQFVSKEKRKKIGGKSRALIISPSGMLKGGAAIEYIPTFLDDPNSAVFLVGYQVEGTPGRKLVDEKIFEFKEKSRRTNQSRDMLIKAKCKIEYFDFSSHADKFHLNDYIDKVKFRNNSKFIFCIHGDEKSTTSFAHNLSKENYNSVAPEIGESYIL